MAFPTGLYSLFTVFLISLSVGPPIEGWVLRTAQHATVLGRGVIESLGWMFGILIAVQLGCLIAIIGGQITAADRREEMNLRSALAVFSFFPIVALAPGVTVAMIAAFRVGELRGSLFVIVPALLLAVSLSVFIGTFQPADELTRLRIAEEQQVRAEHEIDALKRLRRASPLWTTVTMSGVLIVVAIGAPLLLMVLTKSLVSPLWVYGVLTVPAVLCVPLTIFVVNVVSAAIKPKLEAYGLTMSIVLLVAAYGLQFAVVLMLVVFSRPFGIGLAIATVYLIVEGVRVLLEAREVRAHREPSGFWRSGGPLAQAGTYIARRAAEKERAETERKIRELKAAINARVEGSPASGGRRRRGEGRIAAALRGVDSRG